MIKYLLTLIMWTPIIVLAGTIVLIDKAYHYFIMKPLGSICMFLMKRFINDMRQLSKGTIFENAHKDLEL